MANTSSTQRFNKATFVISRRARRLCGRWATHWRPAMSEQDVPLDSEPEPEPEPEPAPARLQPAAIDMRTPYSHRLRTSSRMSYDKAAEYGNELRILRRYFFAQPAAHGTYSAALHFDVLLDADDKIDASTDHLRYRYVDFLTLPVAASIITMVNGTVPTVDVATVRRWLDSSKPKTKLEAYPMFVVAKQMLKYLLSDELVFTHEEQDRLNAELVRPAVAAMIDCDRIIMIDTAACNC